MTTIKLRFVINRSRNAKGQFTAGNTREALANAARTLTAEVAFEYSGKMFDVLKSQVEARVEADIQRELARMAQLLMKHVIGIEGRNRGPTGTLKTVAPRADGFPGSTQAGMKSLVPSWHRRSPAYLKRSAGFGNHWFRRMAPGPLDRLRAPQTWEAAFGGINVTLKKTGTTNKNTQMPMLRKTFSGQGKIGVATLRVEAMTNITPAMLPALGGGGLGDYGANPRKSGLLSLLGDDIANRLGGNPKRVPFRPTIQPFLGFFLTRAMPNAVMRRLEQGLHPARWQHVDIGSAGRRG